MERTALISILGIAPDATTGEVRNARRFVARRLHPDIAGGDTPLMSEVNAACDAWITEIRRRRSIPVEQAAATSTAPDRRARADLRPVDVLATIGLIVAVALVVAAGLGPSGASIAAGLLAGAVAAAVYLAVLHHLAARR